MLMGQIPTQNLLGPMRFSSHSAFAATGLQKPWRTEVVHVKGSLEDQRKSTVLSDVTILSRVPDGRI